MMARPAKADLLAAVHAEALAEYNRTWGAMEEVRKQCTEDRRFVGIAGAMWEGQWEAQFKNRPRLEFNFAQAAVNRIISEMRNNPVTVDFVPRDGSSADELADTCDMLYRADYEDSCGDEAVDNASEEAVSGGFGAFRLTTRLEDEYADGEEGERQRIRFEPIFDADTSVFFDMDAKRQDKSDAKHCWVVYSITREGFKAKYSDDPATWPKATDGVQFDWCTPNVVYVAEYYKVVEKRVPMVRFRMPDGSEQDFPADDVEEAALGEEGAEYDAIRMIELLGGVAVKQWKQRERRVHKYIMSGGGVLEDCGIIAGKHIPVVPIYGKRWFIDNVERCMGAVRLSKDALRLNNMQMSKLAETAALSATEKPIVHPEQVAGLEQFWKDDNIENYAYLPLHPLTDANGTPIPGGPVGYTKPPQVPPAMAAIIQLSDGYRKELLGSDNNGDEMVSNISAKSVEMIQTRVDMASFIYMSNRAKAIKRAGEIWLSMAQDVYVEDGRVMKGISLEGDAQAVKLNKPMIDAKTGKETFANDLSRAKLDVSVDVGPSFTSRRDAMVRTFTSLMQMTADPAKQSMLLSLAIMNMDGEGLTDVREYERKQLVGMGVLQPNEEERAAMDAAANEPQQPDPQAMYLMAEAQKAEAQTGLAVANTAKAEADTEAARAKTAQTLASIDTDRVKVAIEAAKTLGSAVAANSQPQGL
jgi:hypothetical protein